MTKHPVTHTSQHSLAFYSFLSGGLAAAPIVWTFIFSTLLSFDFFRTWQSELYTWSVVYVQILALLFCASPRYLPASRYLVPMCMINVALTILCMLCWTLVVAPRYTIPALFVTNAIALTCWVRTTAEVVYICPDIYRRCYELGMLCSVVLYYAIVDTNLYTTTLFMVPFMLSLPAGLFAIRQIQLHEVYQVGLERCAAVYIHGASDKYVFYGPVTVAAIIKNDIFALAFMTICCITGIISLAIFTPIMFGLRAYLFVFCFGHSYCGGFMVYRGRIMAAVYLAAAMGLLVCFHVWYPVMSIRVSYAMVFIFFILYFNAAASLLYVIRTKISRCINMPLVLLGLSMFCNFAISVTFITTNKLNII
ncbi:envelope protein UL43 [Common bottlenose dolphin gammaherpesvirus 1 strain Sarasota]|uniref:Envelope protein UL43 n=1 Tax=Common bottlenose dolphin gammaherpesvirus 1 strain Sarasota TaxID=2022783 RepID=A0A1Z1NEH6_9GAMA|nr:envelope protein UL43 [Common bottlenose dolphin gammaherpesvirus 1 strain Sarasota]ARW78120.1 envelope protein UL43 [Common bottlenose dolphin gammaherpesvirus 1 strain Sarasota]